MQPPVGESMNHLVRKPDAGNPHVRFDERGVETESMASYSGTSNRKGWSPLRLRLNFTAPLLDSTNAVVSSSALGSEKIRKNKDEDRGPGVKATEPQDSLAKVSNNFLKQTIGHCHPLFRGSNSQESTHQQAQVKASRRDLVAFSEIFCSP